MSKVIVDNLQGYDNSPLIPLSEIGYRIINTYEQVYTAGQWNPNDAFNWVPGQHADYKPVSSLSRIRVYCTIPYARRNAGHAISYWIFYANEVELGRHNINGTYIEDTLTYTWDVPSWGAGQIRRIGYKMRAHTNNSNELRLYCTTYWNGSGSVQNCKGSMSIHEYLTTGL